MRVIGESEWDKLVAGSERPVVVDFFADWCGPCKMLKPVLDEVAGERADLDFYAVDIDESAALTAKYRVMSVPTVVLFKDGEPVSKFVGAQPKAAVQNFIDDNI